MDNLLSQIEICRELFYNEYGIDIDSVTDYEDTSQAYSVGKYHGLLECLELF